MTSRKEHWDRIHEQKPPEDLTWFQSSPTVALQLLELAGARPESSIIDVGGGTSRLVDHLLSRGYRNVAVLDVSSVALGESKRRLGQAAASARWIVGDVLEVQLPERYDIWHDRAVFHFLTDSEDRRRYSRCLFDALEPAGHAIIATFAEDGPQRCSGLPCVRYSPQGLEAELGRDRFRLIASETEAHQTPRSTVQSFQYSLLRKLPSE